MSLQRLVISNFRTGLETNLTPFNINNDAFPVLINAYIWRGRLLRKRGIQFLGRLRRDLEDQRLGNTGASPWSFNIYTLLSLSASQPDAQLVSGTVVITLATPIVFTDQGDGTLTSPTAGNSGTIDYSTGDVVLTHTAGAGIAATVTFSYYPALPVMGLEDFNVGNSPQPILISFDTLYSYGFNQGTNLFYDVNFYKVTGTAFTWNGQNYQQFWTTNYLGTTPITNTGTATGCLWATNGNPGFHFQSILTVTNANPTVITTAANHNLVDTDWVWFNQNSSADGIANLNGQSFQATVLTPTTFSIPLDSLALAINNTGIFQTLTSSGITSTVDGIRWYDGDPTSAAPPDNPGWVNFAPPLSAYDPTTNPLPQYLVGAKIIVPFKNRLLFGAVYVQTTAGSAQFIPNRYVYSQVGIPYYTNPLPADLSSLTPQTDAWYQNVAGKGGFIGAPIDDQIITAGENEDILITIFQSQPFKLIYTSNDTLPFVFQTVSAELGGLSTFAGIKLDTGLLSIGTYGFTMTTSTSVQRIDLQIPEEVFSIAQASNKTFRITGVRDYQKEYIYFSFCPSDRTNDTFNTRTLVYNYRENNWAQFEETFTTYGTLRRTTSRTWANIGQIYPTWAEWTDPWNYGLANSFEPIIIGGNQQGFVMQRSFGTSEESSKFIQAVSGNLITSPDHGLQSGAFIEISGMLGSTNLNGTIQQITVASADTFTINDAATGTYIGGGVYSQLSVPFIQTKQFPIYWSEGRQTRIGTARLLLQTNPLPESGGSSPQITLNLYANQNPNTASNDPNVQPYFAFSNIVLTCPENDNAFSSGQSQTWHRLSTSINGDTVQIGITLSDDQMLDDNINQQEIIVHALVLDLYKGPVLA
jgi:hypothetical protein